LTAPVPHGLDGDGDHLPRLSGLAPDRSGVGRKRQRFRGDADGSLSFFLRRRVTGLGYGAQYQRAVDELRREAVATVQAERLAQPHGQH
jgi:hypothetical protein